MKRDRSKRLNSLLKEVLSEVIKEDVRHPLVSEFITVTDVKISKDLRNATIYISVIGNADDKKNTVKALRQSAGFISKMASKKVVLKYFPSLFFKLDNSIENFIKIEEKLEDIRKKDERDLTC